MTSEAWTIIGIFGFMSAGVAICYIMADACIMQRRKQDLMERQQEEEYAKWAKDKEWQE